VLSIPFYKAQSVVGHAFLCLENCRAKAFTPELYITGHVLKQLILGQSTALFGEKKHTLGSA
jgi:hypothetical protein